MGYIDAFTNVISTHDSFQRNMTKKIWDTLFSVWINGRDLVK